MEQMAGVAHPFRRSSNRPPTPPPLSAHAVRGLLLLLSQAAPCADRPLARLERADSQHPRRSAEGRKSQTALRPKRREVPNGARSQTALGPKRRHVPNGAKSQTAGGRTVRSAFAHFGISRISGLRALRDFALFGTSRSSEVGAVRPLAPYSAAENRGLSETGRPLQ
jgi:hypothetical protein